MAPIAAVAAVVSVASVTPDASIDPVAPVLFKLSQACHVSQAIQDTSGFSGPQQVGHASNKNIYWGRSSLINFLPTFQQHAIPI